MKNSMSVNAKQIHDMKINLARLKMEIGNKEERRNEYPFSFHSISKRPINERAQAMYRLIMRAINPRIRKPGRETQLIRDIVSKAIPEKRSQIIIGLTEVSKSMSEQLQLREYNKIFYGFLMDNYEFFPVGKVGEIRKHYGL